MKAFLFSVVIIVLSARAYADIPFPPADSYPIIGTIEPLICAELKESNNFTTLFWGGPALVYTIPPWYIWWEYLEAELAVEQRLYFLSTNNDGWFASVYGGLGGLFETTYFRNSSYLEINIGLTLGIKTGYKFAFETFNNGKNRQRFNIEPYFSVGNSIIFLKLCPSFSFGFRWNYICLTAGLRIVYEFGDM